MSDNKSAIDLTPLQQEKIDQAAKEKYPYVWPKNKHGEDIVMRVGQKAPPNNAKIRKLQQAFTSGASYYEKECMPGHLAKAMEWISLKGLHQEIDGKWYDKFGGKVRMVAETTKDLLVLFEKYKQKEDGNETNKT